jgi:hypothetical protein
VARIRRRQPEAQQQSNSSAWRPKQNRMKISLTVHFFKVREQGDQIGRFFAYGAFVYFGQFVIENSISTSNLDGFLFSTVEVMY